MLSGTKLVGALSAMRRNDAVARRVAASAGSPTKPGNLANSAPIALIMSGTIELPTNSSAKPAKKPATPLIFSPTESNTAPNLPTSHSRTPATSTLTLSIARSASTPNALIGSVAARLTSLPILPRLVPARCKGLKYPPLCGQ